MPRRRRRPGSSKRHRGSSSAALLVQYWDEIEDTPLGHGLKELYAFVYGEKLP